jgi:DNA polymerase II small subunit
MYRGTLLINSGTWQRQTDFQRRVGLTPTPGIVPIVDLQNLTVSPFDFLNTKVFH